VASPIVGFSLESCRSTSQGEAAGADPQPTFMTALLRQPLRRKADDQPLRDPAVKISA
jgi:hypothetical protein